MVLYKTQKQTPPVSAAPKLLDQLRHHIRRLHYSVRTEEAYVYWVRWLVRFSGLRHPRDMDAPEMKTFLTHLAVKRKVSASTQNQALSANDHDDFTHVLNNGGRGVISPLDARAQW